MSKVHSTFTAALRDFKGMPDMNGWQSRHLRALAGRGHIGDTIISALEALARYADAHNLRFESSIGEDGVLGDYWLDSVKGLRGLLNGEMGPGFDCGMIDSAIVAMVKAAGFDTANL